WILVGQHTFEGFVGLRVFAIKLHEGLAGDDASSPLLLGVLQGGEDGIQLFLVIELPQRHQGPFAAIFVFIPQQHFQKGGNGSLGFELLQYHDDPLTHLRAFVLQGFQVRTYVRFGRFAVLLGFILFGIVLLGVIFFGFVLLGLILLGPVFLRFFLFRLLFVLGRLSRLGIAQRHGPE